MQELFGVSGLLGVLLVTTAIAAAGKDQATTPTAATPTFTRDVAPILYKNCVQCHRAGEIAPMSLVTYEEVRPMTNSQ